VYKPVKNSSDMATQSPLNAFRATSLYSIFYKKGKKEKRASTVENVRRIAGRHDVVVAAVDEREDLRGLPAHSRRLVPNAVNRPVVTAIQAPIRQYAGDHFCPNISVKL
jgi:hypothetical protein